MIFGKFRYTTASSDVAMRQRAFLKANEDERRSPQRSDRCYRCTSWSLATLPAVVMRDYFEKRDRR